jgi:hypothetical protein
MTMSNPHRTSVVASVARRDAPVAHRKYRGRRKERSAVNALATLYVNQHLQDLLDEAARDRVRRAGKAARRPSRIASVLSSLRQAVSRRPAFAA